MHEGHEAELEGCRTMQQPAAPCTFPTFLWVTVAQAVHMSGLHTLLFLPIVIVAVTALPVHSAQTGHSTETRGAMTLLRAFAWDRVT